MESEVLQRYLKKVEKELQDLCGDVLNLLREILIPQCPDENHEEMVFYLKMAGDYYRFVWLCSVPTVFPLPVSPHPLCVAQSRGYQPNGRLDFAPLTTPQLSFFAPCFSCASAYSSSATSPSSCPRRLNRPRRLRTTQRTCTSRPCASAVPTSSPPTPFCWASPLTSPCSTSRSAAILMPPSTSPRRVSTRCVPAGAWVFASGCEA